MEGGNPAVGDPKGENSFILGRSQSEASEMSYNSDTKQLVELERKDDVLRGSIPMTAFNFINSIIGSGIIGIPYALKQAGFGLGIFLLILTAVINDHSIILLVEAGKLSNTDSYQDMIMVACGRPGFYILTLLQFLYPLIAMISYNVIIGDTVTKIIVRIGKAANLGGTVLGNRQFIIFLSTLMVTLPLSLYRNIAQLSKWAFLSIILVFFILVTICIRTGEYVKEIPPTTDAWYFADYNIAQSIGIMAFAYMCHHNTFLIHGSLENPTHQRWTLVTHLSIGFSMTLMLILGILGYVSFTGHTQGDLLENYCHDDDLMNVSRFVFALSIMLTYPIECFVTREVIENAFFPSQEASPTWRHLAVTIGVVLLTVAISMTTDCLGIVLTFNGVMVASPLAFIIPPICVMKLRQEPILSKKNIIPIAIATFGTLVTAFGVIVALVNLSEGFSCSHGSEMPYCVADKVATNGTTALPISISTGSSTPIG
ncbi:putative sodium-coupled neutral amino acid transporter 11 isoform X2 [Crassostrea virginica]